MIKKIKKLFYNLLYSIPFGIKGASDEMFSQKASENSDVHGIHQISEKKSLGGDLIKGEVTEQVEELRYRNYKVYNESKYYKYLGDGEAVKLERNNGEINFSQENRMLCSSVLDEMRNIDNGSSIDTYTLSIIYEFFPRFRLESYCKEFNVVETNNKMLFEMHFSIFPDTTNSNSYLFLEELKKIDKSRSEYKNIIQVSFVTYKAINEDDLIKYDLFNLKLQNILKDEKEIILYFSVENYNRLDLTSKFYSKSMDEKYSNKDKKMLDYNMSDDTRKRYCSQCGKEISVYDGDITEQTYGFPLCSDCLTKVLDF